MKFMEKINNVVYFIRGDDHSTETFLRLRNLVIGMLITAILMWSYMFNVLFTLGDFYHLKTLCVVYVAAHLLSPLIFKVYPSINLTTNIFIFAGLCFQFHYSLATGGFYSSTPVWFSILPLLAGIITDKKNLFIWAFISIFALGVLYYLDQIGFVGHVATPLGSFWGQSNVSAGYVVLNTLLIWAYIDYRDKKNKIIEEQTDSIRNLLRIISHDISNPLAVIKLGTNIFFKKHSCSEQCHEILQNNLQAVENIRQIIDHTRELEAIESGKKKLILEEVDLCEVIKSSFNTFVLRAQEKEIDLVFEGMEDKVKVMADKICLENQVFNNILSNAIKFTSKGNKVSVRVHRDQSDIHVFFEDNGVGIREESLANLFSNSETTSTRGTEGEKGTGFGLPIVKSILNKMDAKISVKSQHKDKFPETHGTTFTLSFKKVI